MYTVYQVASTQITWSMFVCLKGNQTMLRIFMIMDPAVNMGIWPCAAFLRIHQLVSHILIITDLERYILFQCRCKDEIITLVLRRQLITLIPFGLWRVSRCTGRKTIWVLAHQLPGFIKRAIYTEKKKKQELKERIPIIWINIVMSCFSLTSLFVWFVPHRDTDIHSEWYRSRGRSSAIWSDFWNGLQRIF